MSFTPKICRTFLYSGQDAIIDTMFWMLNCCKTSAVSNYHYLFYRQKLITNSVDYCVCKRRCMELRSAIVELKCDLRYGQNWITKSLHQRLGSDGALPA